MDNDSGMVSNKLSTTENDSSIMYQMVPNSTTIITQQQSVEEVTSPSKSDKNRSRRMNNLRNEDLRACAAQPKQEALLDKESSKESNNEEVGSVITFGSQVNTTKEMDQDLKAFKQQIQKGEYQPLIQLEEYASPRDHAANETTGEPSYELTPQTDRANARAIHYIYPETFDMQLARFQQTQDEKLKFKTAIQLNESSVLYNQQKQKESQNRSTPAGPGPRPKQVEEKQVEYDTQWIRSADNSQQVGGSTPAES